MEKSMFQYALFILLRYYDFYIQDYLCNDSFFLVLTNGFVLHGHISSFVSFSVQLLSLPFTHFPKEVNA